MSRRRSRLRNQLSELAKALEELEPITGPAPATVESARTKALALVHDFLLPRLGFDRPPAVVTLVGSTGAGKSTILNSLAGASLAPVGVLRPTTKDSRFWVSKFHVPLVSALVGDSDRTLTVGDHPLLQTVVLVDTPDIDSDLPSHGVEALAIAQLSDALLFVTTAARYGDAIVWETLTRLAKERTTAVVLNRVPSRAGAARNDLLGRLRRAGLPAVPVFTVSEQRIDPARRRLSPQTVQRIAGYLRELVVGPEALDLATTQAVEALDRLIGWVAERNRIEAEKSAEDRLRLEQVSADADSWRARNQKRLWRRPRPLPSALARALEEADRLAAGSTASPYALDALEGGRQALIEAEYEGLWR